MRAPSPSIGESIAVVSVSASVAGCWRGGAGGGRVDAVLLQLVQRARTSRRSAPAAPASISVSIAAARRVRDRAERARDCRSAMPGLPLSSRSFAIASAGAAAGSKPASSSLVSSGFVRVDYSKWMPILRSRGSLCARFPNCQVFHARAVAINENEKPRSQVPSRRITPRPNRARPRLDTRGARYSISAIRFFASRTAN